MSSRQSFKVSGTHNVTAGRDINQNINLHSSKTRPVKSFRLIDKPVPHFTGREKLIKEIHGLLKECATKIDYAERIVVLRGIGGMGKSESARKYVEKHINHRIIKNVVWIDAETKDSTKASFTNLARALKLETKGKETKELAQEFYSHFSLHIKTGLIIFDNVEQLRDQSPYHGILNYLPTQLLDHVPLILITSRINDWEVPLENEYIIEISGLSEGAAVKYLYKNLRIRIKENSSLTHAFRRLAKAIDGYPLGLTLAASTITSYGSEDITTGVTDYITRLDASKQEWIQDKYSPGAATNYKLLMNAVWDATIQKMKTGTGEKDANFALELLSIMAYFPADDIKSDTIIKLYESALGRTLADFNKGMQILKRYSLASYINNTIFRKNNYIGIHRHVQRCSRMMLESANDYSYLGIIASFKYSNVSSMELKRIKNTLELWPWSETALEEFMQLFLQVIQKNGDIAWEMKVCLDKALTVSKYAKHDLMISYYSSMYYQSKWESLQGTKEVLEFDASEENAFLCAAKAFFNVKDVPVYLYDEENKIRLTLGSLWGKVFFQDNLISRLKDKLRSKFGDILCTFANNSLMEPYDWKSITRIYKYFTFYYDDDFWDDSQKYVVGAIRCYRKYQRITYWDFPFSSFSKFFDLEGSNWKLEYEDTFFDEGGTKMIVDALQSLKYVCIYSANFPMLELVIQMTRYPGCSQKLAMTVNFMDQLKHVTKGVSKPNSTWEHYCFFLFLVIWLGLFTPNKTLRDPDGKEWSITSVAEEIKLFVERYQKDVQPLTRNIKNYLKELKPVESLLNAYTTSPAGVHDDLTAEVVKIYDLQDIIITRSQSPS